jgi:release factor glutamine methyltransferase
MPETIVTLSALIPAATERLRAVGIPEPRREATRIWADLAGTEISDVVVGQNRAVDPRAVDDFVTAVRRRARGEPLAHATGVTGFRHLSLIIDARALIPRPETEGLVDLMLRRVSGGRILDVGTGSGCLALSLAQEGGFSEVVGVDCSADALALARLNQQATRLPITLIRGHLCQPFGPAAFDALISNPPYLTAAEYRTLDPAVRDWEPAVALVSGADGMAATAALLHHARDVLRPGGWLALEVDCSRAPAVAAQANALGWAQVSVHMDLFGRERYLLAQRSNTR